MVCLRNISVDTLHKGDTEDNNNNNNNIDQLTASALGWIHIFNCALSGNDLCCGKATICSTCVCWGTCYCQQYNNTESRTKMLLWRISVTANNKRLVGLHVKCPMVLFAFKQIFSLSTDFQNVSNIKFHRNLSIGSRADTCQLKSGQTEGQRYMRIFGLTGRLLKTHWIPKGLVRNLGSWYNISIMFVART
jgi:hypothetical protein